MTSDAGFEKLMQRMEESYRHRVAGDAVPVKDFAEKVLKEWYELADRSCRSEYEAARMKYTAWTILDLVFECMEKQGLVLLPAHLDGYEYEYAEPFSELKPVPHPTKGAVTSPPD